MNIKIKYVNSHIELTDKGAPADNGHIVFAVDERGGEHYHEREDLTYNQVNDLVRRVREAGEINEEHWPGYRAPYGTQAWLDDGCEEAQIWEERYGLEAMNHEFGGWGSDSYY
mgnify:CR=1 FL=1